jgi:hypothetical protein
MDDERHGRWETCPAPHGRERPQAGAAVGLGAGADRRWRPGGTDSQPVARASRFRVDDYRAARPTIDLAWRGRSQPSYLGDLPRIQSDGRSRSYVGQTATPDRRPLVAPTAVLSAELAQAGIQQWAQTLGVVVGACHDQNAVVRDGTPPLHVHDPVVDFLRSPAAAPHLRIQLIRNGDEGAPVSELWMIAKDCTSDSLGASRSRPAGLRSLHRHLRSQPCNS